jgi:hypothetical protein
MAARPCAPAANLSDLPKRRGSYASEEKGKEEEVISQDS